MTALSSRCKERQECEDFQTLLFTNICKRIRDGNPITGEFMSKVKPEISCPIKPVGFVYDFIIIIV